jgi:peroxiredoxin Q/BCP
MSMPAEGSKAPAFSGKDQDGKTWSLKDFKGKKLVLYFYPQDNTPTCTDQACHLRDHFAELRKEGIQVIGVSPDDTESHQKFATKHRLPFPLLEDPKHRIIDKYGVWGPKQMFGNHYMGLLRTSFVIDEKGKVVKLIRKPKVRAHVQEILAAYGLG